MQTSEIKGRTFSRQEFYDRIWSMPATKFASELGISDVMIGKVCKDYLIPKPYPGYWAKIRHGKAAKRTRLPALNDPQLQTLAFGIEPKDIMPIEEPRVVYDSEIEEILEQVSQLDRLVVRDQLRSPHRLVAEARQAHVEDLKDFKERQYSGIKGRRKALAIDVSPKQLNRALRIMDAFIKRVEMIGGQVELKPRYRDYSQTKTIVVIAGEEVAEIRIREICKQVKSDPKKQDRYTYRSTDRIPTGMLMIDSGPGSYMPPHLKDTAKKHLIEDELHDWVVNLICEAGDLRIERFKREEALRRKEENERIRQEREDNRRKRREEFEAKQNSELMRVEELVANAESWRKSRLILEYLEAAQQMVERRDTGTDLRCEVVQYFRWAREQADRFDPLKPSPHSIFDEEFVDSDSEDT